jgi:hypothetical protein
MIVLYRGAHASAVRLLAALKRDGWIKRRRLASHQVLAGADRQRSWTYHYGVEVGRADDGQDRSRLRLRPLLERGSDRTI